MRDELTKILYQNSHDDSECLRIYFERIDFVVTRLQDEATQKLKTDAIKLLKHRKQKLEARIEQNSGSRANIETKARLREIEYLLNLIES